MVSNRPVCHSLELPNDLDVLYHSRQCYSSFIVFMLYVTVNYFSRVGTLPGLNQYIVISRGYSVSFVMFYCVFVTFPCGILSQVWHLIVSIPDLCHLSYFAQGHKSVYGESHLSVPLFSNPAFYHRSTALLGPDIA